MAGAKHLRVAVLVVLCVGLAREVQAEPDMGEAYAGWAMTSFELVGAPGHLEDALRDGLALAGRRRLLRTRHPDFTPSLLRDDLARTRLFLARKGYPHAVVEPRLNPHANKRSLRVALVIQSGERVMVDSLEVRGIRPEHLGGRHFPIRSGDPFDQAVIEEAKREISKRAREAGYAHALTTVEAQPRGPARVHLVFTIELGDRQHFGAVQVLGVPEDLEKVARRSVQIRPGEQYSSRAMQRTEENLRYLGLFRRVHLVLQPVATDTLDLELDLLERNHRQLQTGVGYFTDDQLRLRVEWSHNNLFKEGRGLGILLRGTKFEQRFSVSVWKPAIIVPRTRGTIATSIARQDEANYEALLTSANGWITQMWSLNTTLRYGLEVSYNDYRKLTTGSIEFQETEGLLTAVVFNWWRETARDRLWPLDGESQSLRVRWAPHGVSQSQFVLFEPDVAFYRKPLRKLIVSGRLRLGLGAQTGSTPIPPNERFYAGGASSHRGFERRRLGPKEPVDPFAPTGGAAKLESAIELRFPLFWSLFGATFVDAGQVWHRVEDMRVDQVEVAGGLGLMLKTPAGPLRIDYAWRLTDQDKVEPRTQFHFSIGNPF